MGCECFDPRVSVVNIQKGFEKSFTDGLQAVGQEVENVFSRARELVAPVVPEMADFTREYEAVGGRLHWVGDKHPVDYHLRRYTAWLIGRGASPDLVLQSKLDRQVFKQVQKAALQLRDGMAINWLSFKTTNPSDGAAFHQLAMVNGKLVQRSRLLPIGDVDKVSQLVTVMSRNRDDLSIATDDGLSPLLGWVTMGKAVDFDNELPGMIDGVLGSTEAVNPWKELKAGTGLQLIWPRIDLGVMSGGAGIGMSHIHLGSVHGEVSVTEVPVYALPVVVAPAASDFRIEERITEDLPAGGQATEVTEGTEKVVVPQVMRLIPVNEVSHLRGVIKAEVSESTEEVMAPQVTLPRYEVGELPESVVQPHPRGGVEVVAEKVVVPQVMRLIPVGDEIRVAALHSVADRQVVEEVITENTEVIEGTEEVVEPTVTRMIPVSKEVEPQLVAVTVNRADVHLGSVHESEEEVITERTELAEGTEELESRKRKFSVFNYDSMVSVIKETFDNKLAERKSVKSVKEKIAWLQRQVANVVADQLIGRNTDEPVLGWLVHGWAMMQFDGIEEKQEVRQFSLSPVRMWADRVTGVARRVKDKFVRTGFSVYKQLFAAI